MNKWKVAFFLTLTPFSKKLAAAYYSEAGVVAGRFPDPDFDGAL